MHLFTINMCVNANRDNIHIAFGHILIVNRCIYDPGHVGIKIYGINGYVKTYLKESMIDTEA